MSKGLETKDKILNTALDMVRESGLDSLTIGDVAKKVPMSKSGVFTHFESRDELLLSLLEFSTVEFTRKVFTPALAAKAGITRMRALSTLWLRWDDEPAGGCPFLSASFEFDDRPGPIRDAIVRTQVQALSIWEKAGAVAVREKEFRADADCAQFAYDIFGNILIYNMFKRLLKNTKAANRYQENFESILKKYQV